MPRSIAIALLLIVAAPLFATIPRESVHYQGVLRATDGTPLDGDFDMVFRFFDHLGTELLIDEHTAAGTGAVTVSEGLFAVNLGDGAISDGPGPGVLLQLSSLFRYYGRVEMEITVNGETLAPKVRIHTAPHAHNARYLDGVPESEFLNTTPEAQVKEGAFTVEGDLTAESRLVFGPAYEVSENGTDLEFKRWGSTALSLSPIGATLSSGSLYLSPSAPSMRWNSIDGFRLGDRAHVQERITILDPRTDYQDASPQIHFSSLDSNRVLSWQGFYGQFRLTDDLYVFGDLIGDSFQTGGGTLDHASSRFTLDDSLVVDGTLQVGNGLAAESAYNRIGSGGGPDSGDITNSDDLFVLRDVEIDETLYLNGDLRMSDSYQPTQHLYFHDGSSQTGDYLRFVQTTNQFEFSNVLQGPVGNHFWLKADSNLRFMFDDDNSTTGNLAEFFHDGSWTNTKKVAEIREDGQIRVRGTLSQNVAFDLAESFRAMEPLQQGDLVAADPYNPGGVRLASAGDAAVLGIVSSRPGVLLGSAPFDPQSLRETWGDDVHAEFERGRSGWEARALERAPELRREAVSPAMKEDPEARAEHAASVEARALEAFFAANFVPVALAGRVPVRVDASYGPISVGDALSASPQPGVAMRADGVSAAIAVALEPLDAGSGTVLGFVTRFETTAGRVEALADEVERRTPDPETGVQQMDGGLQIVLDRDADDEARFTIVRESAEGGLARELFRVDERGDVYTRGALRPHAMDVAEYFPVAGAVTAGDVLAIDPQAPGLYRRASEAADRTVIGIVATDPGILLGGSVQRVAAADPLLAAQLEEARTAGDAEREARIWKTLQVRFAETHAPVALNGTVPVKVDAGYGAVRPGDLLVASPTPGHAMRADDPRPGTIVGKALESLDAGLGTVRVLVMLR